MNEPSKLLSADKKGNFDRRNPTMSGPGNDDVRLTDEQRRALETRLVSVGLSAGAGCGKTTVLTERFLREIDGQSGRSLGSMAAMTFTEKAARELRQRIRARCRSKIAAGVDRDWWTLALRALEAAPIGTFHEFCGGMLRGRAELMGLDPDFVILDEIIAASLREQAAASAIRRLLANRDPDLLVLGVDYGLRTIREMLESTLASRTPEEIASVRQSSPDQLIARWRTAWDDRGRPAALSKIGPAARRCRVVLESLPQQLSRQLAAVRQNVLDCLGALDSPNCSDDALRELHEAAKIVSIRGKDAWPSADVKDSVGDIFKTLRGRISDVLKLEWDDDVTLESAETAIRFARVAGEARRDYDDLKRERQGLDFADLIAGAREALGRDPGIGIDGAEEPNGASSGVEFILVDEFQDTDGTQSDVLRLLAGDGFKTGRLFVVGDAKQSIYRFRGAEPNIFGHWRGEFVEEGRLPLSENFRTVPRVLDFVNALFADSFLEFDGSPSPPLIPRRPDFLEDQDPAVHFFWVEAPEPDDGDSGPSSKSKKKKPSAGACRVAEAEALALWLRGRLDDGWTVADRKSGKPRPAQAGDVALLLRAMTDVWPYETALADQGFDYHTIGGSAFYSQQEVLDVINLLSVIEDPTDETALAGALRGPFFSLTDEGLFWLSKTPGGLIAGLERGGDVPGLSEGDRAQSRRASRLLRRWRDLKDHAPMASILERALEESGFAAALVCEFLGARKLANVRKLVRTARDFDRQGGFGLADFVSRLRAFADDPPKEEQAAVSEEGGQSVRIMTVHQAKGLEFPIVILPDLNRGVGPKTNPMGFERELRLVVKPPDGNCLGWLTHRAIEEREEREESLRLFYVAATRARDHLVLSSGFATPPGEVAVEKLPPALNLVWERFDCSTGAHLVKLPDGWPEPAVSVVNTKAIGKRERRAARSAKLELQEIIAAIDRGESAPWSTRPVAPVSSLPGFIDLDAPLFAPSRVGRVGALIRSAAMDPSLFAGESVEEVAARAGLRQTPGANSRQINEAAGWLNAWVESRFFDRIRNTPADQIRGPQSWTLRPGSSTTARGSCDALVRADDGAWRPLVFLAPGESRAWGRARASLSLLAMAGEFSHAWLISVNSDGIVQTERRDKPADKLVGAMLLDCC